MRHKGAPNVLEHLAAHARATGEVPEELELLSAGPPVGTESVWSTFLALHVARGSNGFGPSPLALSDILAYSALYAVEFTSWELDMLLELDSTVLRALNKKGGKDGV